MQLAESSLSRNGDYVEHVRYLIRKGADLEKSDVDRMAADSSNGLTLVAFVSENRPQLFAQYSNSMLSDAVRSGCLETVEVCTY